jgi:hypothetical protein
MCKRFSLYTGGLCNSSDGTLGFATAALVKIQVFRGVTPLPFQRV